MSAKQLVLSGVLVFGLHLNPNWARAATALWTGGGGDASWNNANNWSNNVLPMPSDDVVISSVSTNVTIIIASDVTVQSLQCSASLSVAGGNLGLTKGASQVGGDFSVTAGRWLSVSGTDTVFRASGSAIIDGANLYAGDGGVLSLPGVQSYSNASTGPTWQASGAGSVLELPALTNLSSSWCCWFYLRALSGGQLRLTNLATIPSGYLSALADGADSRLDLPALRAAPGAYYPINFEARNGGTVWAPQFWGGPQVGITVRSGGVLPTVQLQQVAGVTADGVALDLGGLTNVSAGGGLGVANGGSLSALGLTNIDGVSLYASDGCVLSLPGVQSYSNANAGPTWQASGAGSVLELPALTNLSSSWCCWFYLSALSGGQLRLTNLATIPSGYLSALADGADSRLDLPALRAAPGAYYPINFEARNGGTVWASQLWGGPQVGITVRSGGVLPTVQLQQVAGVTANGVGLDLGGLTNVSAGGGLSVANGGSLSALGLTNIDGVSLYASDGCVLSLPGVQSYSNANAGPTWQASGAGSVLELPALTNLSSSWCCWFYLSALNGGQLRLTNLATIPSGYLSALADGADSRLDLPALRAAPGAYYPINFEARNGGTVWAPQLWGGPQVGITVRSGGVLPTVQLQQVAGVTADGVGLDLGGLTNVSAGGGLSVANGGSLSALGLTNIDGVSLYASDGCVLSLPGVQSYSNANAGPTWQASGAGSVLELPALTNLSSSWCCWFYLRALSGGQLRLTNLATVNGFYLDARADGSGSELDVSGSSHLVFGAGVQMMFIAQNGGRVDFRQVQSISGVGAA